MGKKSKQTKADVKSVEQHQQAMSALSGATQGSSFRFFRKSKPGIIERVAGKAGYYKAPF